VVIKKEVEVMRKIIPWIPVVGFVWVMCDIDKDYGLGSPFTFIATALIQSLSITSLIILSIGAL
jgi:hypothetical protein